MVRKTWAIISFGGGLTYAAGYADNGNRELATVVPRKVAQGAQRSRNYDLRVLSTSFCARSVPTRFDDAAIFRLPQSRPS